MIGTIVLLRLHGCPFFSCKNKVNYLAQGSAGAGGDSGDIGGEGGLGGGMRRKRHQTRSKIINRLSAEH